MLKFNALSFISKFKLKLTSNRKAAKSVDPDDHSSHLGGSEQKSHPYKTDTHQDDEDSEEEELKSKSIINFMV
jgi:hypothetical protein